MLRKDGAAARLLALVVAASAATGLASAHAGAGERTAGTEAGVAPLSDESSLIRLMAGIPSQDQVSAAETLSREELASALYRTGHYGAAKELLCDRRQTYDEFKRAGSPCHPRPQWDAIDGPGKSFDKAADGCNGFNPRIYRNAADCLTAAHVAHLPLGTCRNWVK